MTPRRVAALAATLVANLLIVAALLWSSTEKLHVSVVVDDGLLTGTVGPTTVQAAVSPGASGQIGFFLQGADPHANVVWRSDGSGGSSAPLQDLLFRLAAESGWANVRVTDLASGQQIYPSLASGNAAPTTGQGWRPVFGGWFVHPFGGETSAQPGLALVGDSGWRRYRVDADLLRPRNAAGVFILAPDDSNGMLFYFRPENRDIMWFQVRDGQWFGPVAAAPYRSFSKDLPSSAQDVLRLILGGYPAALGLLLLLSVVAFVELAIRGRRGTGVGSEALHPVLDGVPSPPAPSPVRGGGASPLAATARLIEGTSPRPRSPSGETPSNPLSLWERVRVREARPASPPDGELPTRSNGAIAELRPALESEPTDHQDVSLRPFADVAGTFVALVGLGLTLYVADAILQRMPHVQDSVAYLFQAKIFALGRLWVPTPLHSQAFVHEFVVMTPDGRWFGKYPPGWPLLLALGVLARAPWVVDPILGALGLLLLYLIGRDVYRPPVGLLAAVLGLAAPFFIFLSGSMMSHASGLLFTLLGTWCFYRAGRDARPLLPAVVAGLGFGIAFLIRPYSALVIVASFALYALARIVGNPADGLRRFAPALVATLPLVGLFFLDNKLYTGEFLVPPQQLWWSFDTVGIGPGHGPWGYTVLDAFNNTSRNLSELLEHGFGWPLFLTLALALVPFLAGRARTWDWLFLGGFLAIVVGYAFWWADGIMYGPRFYYEGFGFLILLTARGIDVALDFGRRRIVGSGVQQTWQRPVLARALVAALVVGLLAYNVAYYLPGQWPLYQGYNYVSHKKLDAVAAAGIHHALVFADVGQSYEWWEYGMVFSANDPLLQGDVIFARDLGDGADRQLMADFPGRAFYRLDGTTLTAFPETGQP